ncbi:MULTISPECIES: DUF1080 domain-containing protein [Sphingomonas]|uniref:3-keto-alpha-glucoside-1,2-lyase/3-keto-2-hydroxy-glucal hydratase domain-containing protein n=1 Tax=Sphingomonas leidyi TaxID=68569 RepID=A0A7X5ZVC4_9SPHN|nr:MULTISPECIES: DUF1080 domain-containing protein [Sphingomonas]NIJ64980.1 hypothetical protein [Sphingomonas leidyi]OJY54075.1 MAG: hypothetical protein BGP17_02830 [Sphingomonas sp. 67-41]
MTRMRLAGCLAAGLVAMTGVLAFAQEKPGFRDTPMLPDGKWRVHDADRPAPAVTTPAAMPGGAPSDAVVLAADAWQAEAAPWHVENGVMTVPARAQGARESNLVSRQGFGDVQLHLEFRAPNPPSGTSQDRGNSGVWFMQRYEVQILDGYRNPTYADGTVGAVYGWKPPLVNAARKPGAWQSYDILFERPRFAADGKLLRPAYVTVLLNGVLVQNHQALLGTTVWRKVAGYQAHGDAAPLLLQDHGSPVSFRNIWVRPLPEAAIAQDLPGEAK